MKKIVMIVALMGVFLITGCGNKITTFTEIDYDTYIEMVDNKESFVLYLGSATCSHCQSFKPTLEQIIKDYQLDIKYIDAYSLTEKEYSILQNKTKLQGTPTVVFIKDGITQTEPKIVGDVSYNRALEQFKASGYID